MQPQQQPQRAQDAAFMREAAGQDARTRSNSAAAIQSTGCGTSRLDGSCRQVPADWVKHVDRLDPVGSDFEAVGSGSRLVIREVDWIKRSSRLAQKEVDWFDEEEQLKKP